MPSASVWNIANHNIVTIFTVTTIHLQYIIIPKSTLVIYRLEFYAMFLCSSNSSYVWDVVDFCVQRLCITKLAKQKEDTQRSSTYTSYTVYTQAVSQITYQLLYIHQMQPYTVKMSLFFALLCIDCTFQLHPYSGGEVQMMDYITKLSIVYIGPKSFI